MNILPIILVGVLAMGVKSQVNKTGFKYWNTYDSLFKKYASEYNLDWKMLKAIAINESSLGQDSRVEKREWSSDGKSRGLMQLTVPTANDYELVDANGLDNPETSIRIAAKFLHDLTKTFLTNTQKIVMSYNQGAGNTLKGKMYALEYYTRWLNHYKLVEENQ